MFDMKSSTALAHVLNQFSVPMFAVERTGSTDTFRFVSMNDEMECSADCDRNTILGTPLGDIFPTDVRELGLNRVAQCAETHGVVRFRSTFCFDTKHAVWDTTLQSAYLSDDHQRIIATSIRAPLAQIGASDDIALDDIHYFSSMADFQIQNLIAMFESHQTGGLFEAEADLRIAKLSGMCRTVQRAVADINKSVQKARNRTLDPSGNSDQRPSFTRQQGLKRCGTLKALTDFSIEPTRWNGW